MLKESIQAIREANQTIREIEEYTNIAFIKREDYRRKLHNAHKIILNMFYTTDHIDHEKLNKCFEGYRQLKITYNELDKGYNTLIDQYEEALKLRKKAASNFTIIMKGGM